jgi:hypothetical protein
MSIPPYEGPHWGYQLYLVGGELAVWSMALTFWAMAHDVVCISYYRRPVEPLRESLLYQGSRTNVMRAHAAVYLVEQLLAFGC